MSKETALPLLSSTSVTIDGVGADSAAPYQLRASGSSDTVDAHCKCCPRGRAIKEGDPDEEDPYAKAERREKARQSLRELNIMGAFIVIVSSPGRLASRLPLLG